MDSTPAWHGRTQRQGAGQPGSSGPWGVVVPAWPRAAHRVRLRTPVQRTQCRATCATASVVPSGHRPAVVSRAKQPGFAEEPMPQPSVVEETIAEVHELELQEVMKE